MSDPIVFIRSLNDITEPGTYAPQNRDGIPFPDSFIQVGTEPGEEIWDEYCLYINGKGFVTSEDTSLRTWRTINSLRRWLDEAITHDDSGLLALWRFNRL